jgi:hypothetical protein
MAPAQTRMRVQHSPLRSSRLSPRQSETIRARFPLQLVRFWVLARLPIRWGSCASVICVLIIIFGSRCSFGGRDLSEACVSAADARFLEIAGGLFGSGSTGFAQHRRHERMVSLCQVLVTVFRHRQSERLGQPFAA